MPREAEPSINEREFIQQALYGNVRIDGRTLEAYRDISITFGEEYGTADVRLGKTRQARRRTETDLLLLTLILAES